MRKRGLEDATVGLELRSEKKRGREKMGATEKRGREKIGAIEKK